MGKLKKFVLFAGLSGGFGGAEEVDTIECENQKQADEAAYEQACQQYDSMAGLHELRDHDTIMEQEHCTADEATEIYLEEMEEWIEYYAKEVVVLNNKE